MTKRISRILATREQMRRSIDEATELLGAEREPESGEAPGGAA